MTQFIQLTLANGEHRHIATGETTHHGIVLKALGQDEWIETLEATLVRRDQIIEALLLGEERPHFRQLAETA